MKNLEKYSPYVLALLRIVAAYMFILHGTAKFWEFPISMTGGNGAVGDPVSYTHLTLPTICSV